MVCDDNARLLHGYLDGELDLVRSLEIEEHLKICPDCAQELWNQQTLRKAFRSSSLYERAPAGLADRIRASIAREAAADVAGSAENATAVKKATIKAKSGQCRTNMRRTDKRSSWGRKSVFVSGAR